MRRSACAVVEPGGVLRTVVSGPPLTIRRVHADDVDTCRLCLVNSAAGPLAGDDITFDLTVAPGAHCEVIAAGASLAQGRNSRPGRLISTVMLGEGSQLNAEPAQLIVCHGASVEVTVNLQLAATSKLRWREMLVLGRASEPGGAVLLQWNVTRAGRPVLRQTLDLRTNFNWPGLLDQRRVLATAFISDPDYRASSEVGDSTAVRQLIDANTVLISVLADDAANAELRLRQLLPRSSQVS